MTMLKKARVILISLVFASPLGLVAEEPLSIAERFAYHEEYDPTTAFLHLSNIDLDRHDQLRSDIIKYATEYIGKPYSRGSKGPNSFDCSGFTSYVFGKFDIDLNSSSSAQYTQGEGIDITEVQPGDLLFFSGRGGNNNRVGHVAIATDVDENGTVKFIHASTSGGVRYDTYPDGGYYTRRFIGVRRVIPESASQY